MPAERTARSWHQTVDGFSPRYARACEIRAEVMFEQILEIARTPQEGEKVVEKSLKTEAGEPTVVERTVTRGDMTDHRKLLIDALKWVVARMQPKKYGDRLTTELEGTDGGPVIIKTVIEQPPPHKRKGSAVAALQEDEDEVVE